MIGGVRLLRIVGALVAALAFAGRAQADSGRVALVRSSETTPAAREVLNRIQGELAAEGFEVVVVDSPAVAAPESGPMPEGGALASIEFVVDAGARSAELRVNDHLTNKTVIRRTVVETALASRLPEVLAVRAVELLRASLVELLLRAPARPEPSPANPALKVRAERAAAWAARAIVPVVPEARSRWGFDAGTAVLFGFSGIGPVLLAAMRLRAALGSSFQLRLTGAGLGTSSRVTSAFGSARVSQDLALVELEARVAKKAAIHPAFSVGVGPVYVAVDGQAAWPYVGKQSSGWALGLDAGAGVEARVSAHFDLSCELHVRVTQPSEVTRFVDQRGPGIGQPSLMATATIVGWL